MDYDKIVKVITEMVREKLEDNEKKSSEDEASSEMLSVKIGVSARHVHLSRAHLDILFGKGYELTKKKELMGGQYAAEECITLVGNKLNTIEKVRILGPLRGESQVELSKTEAVKLGVKAPIRESGNIKDSAPITIVGPKGAVFLKEGCIIAKRHIHMSEEDSKKYGFKDNDVVDVQINSERGGVLSNVQVRVHKTYTLEMHIDTDEANALGIECGCMLPIVRA